MDCMYKKVGGRIGRGGWAAEGGLQLPTGLFEASMSPTSASHRPRQAYRGPKRSLTNTEVNIRCIPSIYSALNGPHCLNHDFTWLVKSALEKQTSQLSLVMQQCMSSVVWLLVEPIKWNRLIT